MIEMTLVYLLGIIIVDVNPHNFPRVLALGREVVEVRGHVLHGGVIRRQRARGTAREGIRAPGVLSGLGWGVSGSLQRPGVPVWMAGLCVVWRLLVRVAIGVRVAVHPSVGRG